VLPGLTLAVVGELVRLKSKPAPDNATVWGLLVALSLTASVPVRVPEAVGVNVTLKVQLALAANEVGQLLVCA
jgi:hypothetical protein